MWPRLLSLPAPAGVATEVMTALKWPNSAVIRLSGRNQSQLCESIVNLKWAVKTFWGSRRVPLQGTTSRKLSFLSVLHPWSLSSLHTAEARTAHTKPGKQVIHQAWGCFPVRKGPASVLPRPTSGSSSSPFTPGAMWPLPCDLSIPGKLDTVDAYLNVT